MRVNFGALVFTGAFLAAPIAMAQDITAPSDTAGFVFNTGLMIAAGIGGLIVVIGFGVRDVGFARTQNAPAVCLRTMGLLGVAAVMFWLTGYNLIYTVEDGGFLGEFQIWRVDDTDPLATGRASGAFWFFQMSLAAITAAIVSGAVSERVKLWPFLIFAAVQIGLIYPIIASWVWGGGYLSAAWSFYDFGGGAVIHIGAGAAALAAVIVVGPRVGRYSDGAPLPAATTALPLSAFGAGLIWVGMMIVMAGKVDSLASVEAAILMSTIFMNSMMAAAGGILSAMFLTQTVYKRAGLVTVISGVVGGLVSIAGDPLHPALWQAAMIGAVGGVIVTVVPPFLDRYRLDDAAFVVPAHLLCGLWGIVIVDWTNPDAWARGQLAGAAGIGAFAFFMSLLVWVALKYSIGVRGAGDHERRSLLERGDQELAPSQKFRQG